MSDDIDFGGGVVWKGKDIDEATKIIKESMKDLSGSESTTKEV